MVVPYLKLHKNYNYTIPHVEAFFFKYLLINKREQYFLPYRGYIAKKITKDVSCLIKS